MEWAEADASDEADEGVDEGSATAPTIEIELDDDDNSISHLPFSSATGSGKGTDPGNGSGVGGGGGEGVMQVVYPFLGHLSMTHDSHHRISIQIQESGMWECGSMGV